VAALLDAPAAHSEIHDVVNALRDGGCETRRRLPPLHTDTRLQTIARQIAKGETLQHAADGAGYQATRLSTIHLSGHAHETDVQQLLANKYCALLMDPAWQQMGSDRRADELWIVLAVPHAIPSDETVAARQVLNLVNRARASSRRCGATLYNASQPLRLNALLDKAAQRHASDMARHKQMTHAGSDGSTPAQRVTRQGYRWKAVGENVAAGAGSAEEVVAGWLASPGHCANIMNSQFTEMGVAFAVNRHDDLVVYWAQNFALPR